MRVTFYVYLQCRPATFEVEHMGYLDQLAPLVDMGVDTCDRCGIALFAGGSVTEDGDMLCSYHTPGGDDE